MMTADFFCTGFIDTLLVADTEAVAVDMLSAPLKVSNMALIATISTFDDDIVAIPLYLQVVEINLVQPINAALIQLILSCRTRYKML